MGDAGVADCRSWVGRHGTNYVYKGNIFSRGGTAWLLKANAHHCLHAALATEVADVV